MLCIDGGVLDKSESSLESSPALLFGWFLEGCKRVEVSYM